MSTTNNIIGQTELALQTQLLAAVVGTVCEGKVYISDSSLVKDPMPYIIARAMEDVEEISPGCGIFKLTCGSIFRSHTKETSEAERQEVITALNNFAYSAPATALSTLAEFHCYGFVPTTGQMTVDPDLKAYIYEMQYELHAMPRDNS